METITLANGMVFYGSTLPYENTLTITLNKQNLQTLYPILSVAENVSTIVSVFGTDRKEYEGFTHLFYLREEGDGSLSAGLKKVIANM